MKNIFQILLLSILINSCSSDMDGPVTPIDKESMVTTGKQAYSIDFKAITAKRIISQTAKPLVPAFALVSISDDTGMVILTREKLVLQKVGEQYFTDEIILDAGSYSLTEFIVTDADNVVISLVPMENSALAPLTETTLPFAFTVQTDETNVSATENIEAEGFTAVDFGYGTLNLIIPESIEYFSLSVDESSSITTKSLVLKSLTGSTYIVDWGDGTIEEYLSTKPDAVEDNVLTHTYVSMETYTISISGPIEVIEYLNFYAIDEAGGSVQSNITSADLATLTRLTNCELYNGRLSTLDTSNNTALEKLSLGYNQISSLDLSSNTALKTAWLRYNQLTDLDVSNNANLEFLWVTGNQMTTLDVTSNSKLNNLYARENQLSSLALSNNLALLNLDISDNALTTIDLTSNANLKEINVGRNNLTGIDLTQNMNITRIDLYGNQIGDIDLSFNSKLVNLYINDNVLTTINLSNNPDMERLIIENNNFSDLDISNNPKIFDFEIGGNQFSGLVLDQLISQIYDQAVLNSTMNGYIDYKNNPGFDAIDISTTDKINDLTSNYNWFFNNNN